MMMQQFRHKFLTSEVVALLNKRQDVIHQHLDVQLLSFIETKNIVNMSLSLHIGRMSLSFQVLINFIVCPMTEDSSTSNSCLKMSAPTSWTSTFLDRKYRNRQYFIKSMTQGNLFFLINKASPYDQCRFYSLANLMI
jgi:hypothetical protein